MSKKSPEQVAAKLAGTPTRYTPPVCHDWVDHVWTEMPLESCPHAERNPEYHWPSSGLGPLPQGFTRRRDGSVWLADVSSGPRPIPARTRENIAACAALGLSYWSEAPGAGRLWAVDDTQQAHEVRIDRKRSEAELVDVWNSWVSYTVATTNQLLFGDDEQEVAA